MVDPTIPCRIGRANPNSDIVLRQRSSSQINKSPEVPSTNTPHRTQVPLHTTVGGQETSGSTRNTREPESCGYVHEVTPNEYCNEMEGETITGLMNS